MITKQLEADIDSLGPGEFAADISTSTLDRDGEVLLPSGMDASEYMKNPVVFWNHNYDQPIAKCNERPRRRPRKDGLDGIRAVAKFADRPADFDGSWFPDMVRAFVEQGIIKGVSVGFEPRETRQPTKKDTETYGEELRRVISKWRLLEFSVVPIPANPDALIAAVGKGLVKREDVKAYFGIDVPDKPPSPPPPEPKARKCIILVPRIVKPRIDPQAVADAVKTELAKRLGKIYLD